MHDPQRHLAGNFAPPLTDALLARYRELIATATEPETADALRELYHLVATWWELPASQTTPFDHPIGVLTVGPGIVVRPQVVALDAPTLAALDDHIPWPALLDHYGRLFDVIPAADPLRDAAHHLLWFAHELNAGREPLTTEAIGLPTPS